MKRIAIHSVPRSGSSWLGEIFNSSERVLYKHQPLFSYAFKNRLNEDSSILEIDEFFNDLINLDDEFIDRLKERKNGNCPIFIKNKKPKFIVYKEVRYHHILSNLMKKDQNIIVIGLVRNPLSVISSWLRAPKEFKKELGWNELEEWRFANKKNINKVEEFNGFEKWKEVAKLFLRLKQEYPYRFYLLEYYDLLNKTKETVKDLFKFCNIEFTDSTNQFLSLSQNKDLSIDAYSVYRVNQVDDKWKIDLPKDIIDIIDQDLIGSELAKFNK